MGPSYRGLMMSLMAFVAFAFTVALSLRPRHEPSFRGVGGYEDRGPDPQLGAGASSSIHALRERAGAPARAVSGQAATCSPSTRRTTASRSSASGSSGLVHTASVPVGLEPVAVAARSERRGLGRQPPLGQRERRRARRRRRRAGHVERTLLVGDEPRDIVFAGPGRQRAFITTAHRGQNIPFDPQLTTPGVGRADVWVFDADASATLARRHAAHHRHPLHRHAARARGDARRHAASTPPASTPATGPPSSPRPSLPDGFGPDGAAGPDHQRRGRAPRPRSALIVKCERRPLGRRARPHLGRRT